MQEGALQSYRSFAGITESWELEKTGLIVIAEESYRLELWHSYSDPDLGYYVSIYVQQDGVWKKLGEPIFPMAPTGDEALRTAMAFLSERRAA